MNRKSGLSLLVILVTVVFTLVASAPYGMGQVIKWRAASVWTPAMGALDKGAKHFVEVVNEVCKGELEVKHFAAGEIVSTFEVFGAVQTGTIPMGLETPLYWAGKNTAFGAMGSLVGGPSQMDMITWIYQGGGAELADELYAKFGAKYFFTGVLGAESGIRGRKEFKKIDDFKGAKIRMSGQLQGLVLKDLGVAHSMLAGQELYQALEKGVIDAAEFSTPDVDWGLGFQDITKVWNVPAWHQPSSTVGVMINKKTWDSLSKGLQAKIKWAAMASTLWSSTHFNSESGIYTKKFLDKGVKVSNLDTASLAEIQKLCFKNILVEAEKNPLFAKVVLSIYQTMATLGYFRTMELGLLSRPVTLPDLETLRLAAAKEK